MYNVLIVDDDTLMRNALRAMISRFKNFQIIGEAANGAEAIAAARDRRPRQAVLHSLTLEADRR